MHRRQAEPGLEPALAQGERLDARVRHRDRPTREPPAAQQHGRCHVEPAVASPRERVQPPGRGGAAAPAGIRAVAEHGAVPGTCGHPGCDQCEHEPRVLERADRQQGRLALPLALTLAAGAGDVDPDPPPAHRPPPQRLHELEGLDAVQRDGRRAQVGQAFLHAHGGAGVGEVEVAVGEQLLDPVDRDADRDGEECGDAGERQRADAADPGPDQPEHDQRPECDGRPVQDGRHEQPAVGHLEHRVGRGPRRRRADDIRPGPGIRVRIGTTTGGRTDGTVGVGRYQGGLVGAAGELEQVLAQRLRPTEVEEGQCERGVGPAGGLHDDPRQAQRPGQQRPRQLDGLHPLEPHLPVLAEQHALAQLDLAPADPEPRAAPAHPVGAGDDRQEEDEPGKGDERVVHGLLERVAPAAGLVARGAVGSHEHVAEAERVQERVEHLGRRVAEDREEHDATPQQRRQGVKPLPLPRGLRNRVGHRPARCASPRAASRAAQGFGLVDGEPGQRATALGEAVWISHEAMPNARIQRTGLDVDVLEPAVGDADQGAQHPALADDDLLVELDPRDRGHLAPDEPHGSNTYS